MSLPIKELLGKSHLFKLNIIDLPDATERALEYSNALLQRELYGKNPKEIDSIVLAKSARGRESYIDSMRGLLYGILVNSDECAKLFILAQSALTDDWSMIMEQLKYFTFTKFSQLKVHVRRNLFWIVDRLVSLSAKGSDGLLLGLLRQIRAGHYDEESLDILVNILNILDRHRTWLFEQVALIPYVVFVLLRILSENGFPQHIHALSLVLASELLREKFKECSLLGRDLIRSLIEVAHYPQLIPFWRWLITSDDKQSAPPIVRLLLTPTPKKYVIMRLTPTMESELKFLFEMVPVEKQNFYFNLFLDAHLGSGDQSVFIADLIRYIVVAHHPTNATLSSNVVPRWSFITFLLKSLRTSYAAASSKLALLLDWFFFDHSADNIMLIEAGLLVITKNIVNSPKISSTLIEFLELMRFHFYPPMLQHISKCLDQAVLECVKKSVIQSPLGLISSPMMPWEIKQYLHRLFPSTMPAEQQFDECFGTTSLDPRKIDILAKKWFARLFSENIITDEALEESRTRIANFFQKKIREAPLNFSPELPIWTKSFFDHFLRYFDKVQNPTMTEALLMWNMQRIERLFVSVVNSEPKEWTEGFLEFELLPLVRVYFFDLVCSLIKKRVLDLHVDSVCSRLLILAHNVLDINRQDLLRFWNLFFDYLADASLCNLVPELADALLSIIELADIIEPKQLNFTRLLATLLTEPAQRERLWNILVVKHDEKSEDLLVNIQLIFFARNRELFQTDSDRLPLLNHNQKILSSKITHQ